MADCPVQAVFNRVLLQKTVDNENLKWDGIEVVIKNNRIYKKSSISGVDFELPNVSLNELYKSQVTRGKIVAIGEGVDPQFEVGMEVVWGKYAGISQEINGYKFEVINDEDIMYKII